MVKPLVPATQRRDLLALALSGGAGLAVGGLAGVTAGRASAPKPQTSAVSVGTLEAQVLADPPASGTEVSVKFADGKVQRLPYQAPYVPVVGDKVSVSVASGGGNQTAIVVAGYSGQSGNLIVNPDFRAMPTLLSKKPPHMWTQQRLAGRAVIVQAIVSTRFQKPMMVIDSYPDTSTDIVAWSAAFPVQAGETINGDAATYLELTAGVDLQMQVDLLVAWHTDPDAPIGKGSLKPLFSRTPQAAGEYAFVGGAQAPVNVKAARVGIRARHSGPDGGQYTLLIGHIYASR